METDKKVKRAKSKLTFRNKLLRVRWRWIALLIMCFFITGAYYSFDNPAELEDVLEKLFVINMT